jgi:hypothetical protein
MFQPASKAFLLLFLSTPYAFARPTSEPSNIPAVIQSDRRVRIDFGE